MNGGDPVISPDVIREPCIGACLPTSGAPNAPPTIECFFGALIPLKIDLNGAGPNWVLANRAACFPGFCFLGRFLLSKFMSSSSKIGPRPLLRLARRLLPRSRFSSSLSKTSVDTCGS